MQDESAKLALSEMDNLSISLITSHYWAYVLMFSRGLKQMENKPVE